MDASFWAQRWQNGETGFHLPRVHPLLERYLPQLSLQPESTLFLPLCGKTLDVSYLLSLEHQVVGVELSELAVASLFDQLGVVADITDWAGGKRWQADGVTIYQGNLFALTPAQLGAVDAVYDRAALVALPPDMRARYAEHLLELTYAAPQLLISFEYDQTAMNGPPFSVPTEEIAALYADFFEMRELRRADIIEKEPRFRERGLQRMVEVAWHLLPSSGRPDS